MTHPWAGHRAGMTVSRLLARPMMSAIFVVGPIGALRNTPQAAKRAEPITGPLTERLRAAGVPIKNDPVLFVRINAGVQLAGAAALATGKCPRLAAGVLAASLVPTTVAGHPFWRETDPEARAAQRLQFAKNLTMLGGLVIAAMDTDGKPGKAWLAKQAVKETVRRTEQLATQGKLEAKIAALEAAGAGDHLAETLESATATARETAAHWAEELRKQARDKGPVLADQARATGAVLAEQARDKGPVLAEQARATGAVLAEQARDKGPVLAAQARSLGCGLVDPAGDATKDWRKELRSQAKELRKQAKQQRKEAGKAASRLADAAGDKGSDWAKQARKQAKQTRKDARKLARKGSAKLAKEAAARVA
jgi:uncharacterized membrane protein YphA (DoxX/SURF4 family)